MKASSLGVLVILTLGLGAYIYFGIQKPAEMRETEVPLTERVVPYAVERIEELRVSIPGQEKLVFESEEGRWRITAPFEDLPSKTKFEGLLSQISQLKQEKLILEDTSISEEKLSPFKLAPPEALHIELKLKNESEVFSFFIGGPNPSKTGTYVYLESKGQVLLASNQLDNLRVETPGEFREKRLLTVDTADIQEIRIKNSSGNFKLEKTSESHWKMLEPEDLPLDQSLVNNQLSKLNLLRANEFLKEKPKVLEKPQIEILIGFKEGVRDQRTDSSDPRPQGTQILMAREALKTKVRGDSADQFEYYAISEKIEPARISRFHFENFDKSYKSFVKKSFDDFSLSEVKEMSVTNKNETFHIQSGDSTFVWDKEAPLVPEALEAAFQQLRNLVAEEFVALEAPPKTGADLELRVKLKSGEEHSFSLKKDPKKSSWWYTQNGRSLKYSLRPDSFDPKVWTEASLQSPVESETNEPKL